MIITLNNSITKSDIYLYNIETKAINLIIKSDNGEYDPEIDFHPDEYVSYPSTDNTIIHAILYRPKELEVGKKYPAIMSL